MNDFDLSVQDLANAHPRTLALIHFRQMRALEKIADVLEKLAPSITKLVHPVLVAEVDEALNAVNLGPETVVGRGFVSQPTAHLRRRRGADDASSA